MKATILKLALILLPFFAVSQESVVDKLFEKYNGTEGYTSVYISNYMFSIMAEIETDDKEFDQLVDNLSNIKILASDDGSDNSQRFKSEIIDQLPKNQYKELMIVKDGDEEVQFLVNDRGGVIYELLIISTSDHESAMISIQGKLSMKQISRLSKSIDIDGLEKLDELEDED